MSIQASFKFASCLVRVTCCIALFICSVNTSAQAQNEPSKPSIFHRLLILNTQNEIMLVKIKSSNRWATPGWYQDGNLSIRTGLDELAATYGIRISDPLLRGVFTLTGQQEKTVSSRLIYLVRVKSGAVQAPSTIEEIRWLPAEKAQELISFPHISAQIKQIMQYPNTLWGGAQLRTLENGVYGVKTLEDFYSLSNGE